MFPHRSATFPNEISAELFKQPPVLFYKQSCSRAGALRRGPEDHQCDQEKEERDDPRDRASVRCLHHSGLYGRQQAQD